MSRGRATGVRETSDIDELLALLVSPLFCELEPSLDPPSDESVQPPERGLSVSNLIGVDVDRPTLGGTRWAASDSREDFRNRLALYMASTYANGHFRGVSEVPVLMVGRQGLEPWTR